MENIPLDNYICVKAAPAKIVQGIEWFTPVGSIYAFAPSIERPDPTIWRLCDGTYLSVFEFNELYQIAGDSWCPKEILEEVPLTFWEKVLRFIGFEPSVVYARIPNPDYREGFFRLPYIPRPRAEDLPNHSHPVVIVR